MGYRRAGHIQQGGNINHAFFTVAQQEEDMDSGSVSKLLEDFCNRLESMERIIKFLFWEGDEEFPSSSQILFSSNFPAAFMTYDLAEIGEICINTFEAIEKYEGEELRTKFHPSDHQSENAPVRL